ncbi:hypothetical protein ACVJBD_004764, partial [Rhizobium mongolense]
AKLFTGPLLTALPRGKSLSAGQKSLKFTFPPAKNYSKTAVKRGFMVNKL